MQQAFGHKMEITQAADTAPPYSSYPSSSYVTPNNTAITEPFYSLDSMLAKICAASVAVTGEKKRPRTEPGLEAHLPEGNRCLHNGTQDSAP